jgi:hypothetical protein
MNLEHLETEHAEQLVSEAIDRASSYSQEHDLDAAVIGLLVRALEVATNKIINVNQVYQ